MKVSERQLRQARFWKKLLRLTRGRVPVLRAFEIIIKEETDDEFRRVLSEICCDLNNGATLSEALTKRGDIFSPSVLALVAAAEKTGAWDEVLQEIAEGLTEGTFD